MVLAELGPAQAGSSRPDWCRYRHARTRPNGRSAPARHRERGSSPALPSERRLRPATVSCAIRGPGFGQPAGGSLPSSWPRMASGGGKPLRLASLPVSSSAGISTGAVAEPGGSRSHRWRSRSASRSPYTPPSRWYRLWRRISPIGGHGWPHQGRPPLLCPRRTEQGSGMAPAMPTCGSRHVSGVLVIKCSLLQACAGI